MKNISELSHCYGCSLCAVICPQQIITLCQDKEGFYQPVIEKNDECTACGLCSKVCAFINDEKEGVSKCAPSFFMHKAPTFTSRGFVIT